jgi:hypothetical protein
MRRKEYIEVERYANILSDYLSDLVWDGCEVDEQNYISGTLLSINLSEDKVERTDIGDKISQRMAFRDEAKPLKVKETWSTNTASSGNRRAIWD